jgi:hypothetical protein
MTKRKIKQLEPEDEENEERLPGEKMVCAETPSILVCERIEEDEDDPEDDDE